MQRALKYFFRTMLLGSAMRASGALLIFLRVSFAPVPLDLRTPSMQRALNPENGPYLFTLSHTSVRWVQEKHALDLQVSVRMKTRGGQTVALCPSLLFSFPHASPESRDCHSVRCRGFEQSLVPMPYARTELLGLWSSVKGEREEQGPLISTPMRRNSVVANINLKNYIERILTLCLPTESHLEKIRLTDSSVTLDDQVLGLTWTAKDIDLEWTHS